MDELVALVDAADAQDLRPLHVSKALSSGERTQAKVAALLAEGWRAVTR
jgi:hypothetical protein